MRRTLMIVAAVAACSSRPRPRPSAAAASARPPLRGTNWVLTDRVSLGTPLDGVAVNAVFAAKRVSGTSGCNGYTQLVHHQRFAHDASTNDGVSTLIACEGAAGKVEPKYLAALARVGRWRITRDDAHALDRAGRRLLVVPGVGRRRTRCAARGTSPASTPATRSRRRCRAARSRSKFAGDTRVGRQRLQHLHRRRSRCSGSRRASTSDRSRRRSAPAPTPRSARQEQQYLAALELAKTYQVTGNQLTLFRDGGTIAVTAQRATT